MMYAHIHNILIYIIKIILYVEIGAVQRFIGHHIGREIHEHFTFLLHYRLIFLFLVYEIINQNINDSGVDAISVQSYTNLRTSELFELI